MIEYVTQCVTQCDTMCDTVLLSCYLVVTVAADTVCDTVCPLSGSLAVGLLPAPGGLLAGLGAGSWSLVELKKIDGVGPIDNRPSTH